MSDLLLGELFGAIGAVVAVSVGVAIGWCCARYVAKGRINWKAKP